MTKTLPQWIQKRYAILWNKFKEKEFTYQEAIKTLKNNKKGINVFLSDLRKADWLEVRLSSVDYRKRVYKLKNPLVALKEMG